MQIAVHSVGDNNEKTMLILSPEISNSIDFLTFGLQEKASNNSVSKYCPLSDQSWWQDDLSFVARAADNQTEIQSLLGHAYKQCYHHHHPIAIN